MSNAQTYSELAATFGTTTEAMRKALNRAGYEFPGKNNVASGEMLQFILERYGSDYIPKPITPAQKNSQPVIKKDKEVQRQKNDRTKAAILYALTAAPVLASVRNIYRTSEDIMQDTTDAAILTAVLTITAPVLVWIGVKGRGFIILLSALILAEVFSNTTAIYYGLMGGTSGNPVMFIGTVTDIFPTGSAVSALIIASFFSALIAAVQYLTIKEIRRK